MCILNVKIIIYYNAYFFFYQGKLDSYKDLQNTGKDLSADQLTAVSKYDEVAQVLEFARDFVKLINTVSTTAEKEQRKTARRVRISYLNILLPYGIHYKIIYIINVYFYLLFKQELAQRTQQEITKIREVFVIQNAIENLSIESVRTDFANGTNGATKLEDSDLEVLEKL